MLADVNDIAIFQPMGADTLFIDKRAVLSLEVDLNKPVTGRINFTVVTGDGQVVDDDIIVFLAPYF